MDQNYEDWDDSNSVTSYYVTPPTSPIIQPVNNADETKNFFRNNANINLSSSLSDLMAEQISLWCDSSSTSQQPNQLNKDNDILISLNDDDYSTTNIVSKVDISQCHFTYMNDSHQTIINASYQGDLAFLYKVGGDLNLNGGGEISCCLNGMSDEISIPFDQLCGFKISTEKKIFIKFKPNFKRTSEIEKLCFKKNGIRNEFTKENRQKLYLTCVFPTERRALAVPMDSSYNKLLLLLESRFNLTIDSINLRFRNKRGDVVVVKSDDCWEMAKSEAYGKNLARLELQIW
ncbi:4222_t:CDS:2 [Dentiscutata erythropus]|uniref:4222_t:CDS:1 n=1 Tax=Dentiscutata erythropus TaxID=1348616 RepID=A0A9N9CKL9_9GLOM|nr:4222_t:CDS:2 [Dentiscutata erythropus]